jgi:fructose-bisphosphate aldolase class I
MWTALCSQLTKINPKADMANQLQSTVAALLACGKGILATDETVPTTESRLTHLIFVHIGESQSLSRDGFYDGGLDNFISAVIKVDETIRQETAAGVPMPEALAERGIILGVSVDKGTVPLGAFPG